MAKQRKTDTNGQPDANPGLDEVQTEGAGMENPETETGLNAAPAEGDQTAEAPADSTEPNEPADAQAEGDQNAAPTADSTEPSEGGLENSDTEHEGTLPDFSGEADTVIGTAADPIARLFSKVMGHDNMPENWTSQNSTKLVRDAWANSKHGRPYPGYDSALAELTKDL